MAPKIGHNSNKKKQTIAINQLTKEEQKQVSDAIKEFSGSLTRVDAETDMRKEIVENITDELGVEKSTFRKLAKLYHKQSLDNEQEALKNLRNNYEILFGTNT